MDVAEAVAALSEVAFDEMQPSLRIPMWIPTRHNSKKKHAIRVLDNIVWKFVRERRADGSDHGDLLSMLLSAADDESGGFKLSDRQVRDEVMTLMLGGYDTTAAAFEWFWYNMASHKNIAEKCHLEILTAIGDQQPKLSDIEKMPYLIASIKETLRLFPPAIGVFHRQALKDVVIGGYKVRKRSLIMVSSFVTQRDERWFKDAELFSPDRFIKSVKDEVPSFAYFPFGGGPRMCIGKTFAMNEIALVAATLLKSFEVSLVPGQNEPVLEVTIACVHAPH